MPVLSSTSSRALPDVPLHAPLSAQYKTTFAYPTIKDRCPIILCKVIDYLYRERINIGNTYGTLAQDGLKSIVEELSKLRYEMQTNKPLTDITDTKKNTPVWNLALAEEASRLEEQANISITWYSCSWMLAECYMYRRMWQAFHKIPSLRDFDFFANQKLEGLRESMDSMNQLGDWFLRNICRDSNLFESEETLWSSLVELALWGNKCDLSISAGSKRSATGNSLQANIELRSNILVNESDNAWQTVSKNTFDHVDFVMDNAGYELFTDLCLADFLLSTGKTNSVRFRVKNQPWFVSDTTCTDFYSTLETMLTTSSNHTHLPRLSARWQEYLNSGRWEVVADQFWTYPHNFNRMEHYDPQLYLTLRKAGLVIIKGDLNYRKLVGDLNWETTVSFVKSLQGFRPTNVLALRTLKADVVTGLRAGQAESTAAIDEEWMINGKWGVIQFAEGTN